MLVVDMFGLNVLYSCLNFIKIILLYLFVNFVEINIKIWNDLIKIFIKDKGYYLLK